MKRPNLHIPAHYAVYYAPPAERAKTNRRGKYQSDDGLWVAVYCAVCAVHGDNHRCERAAPLCVDCGVGRLRWAEAGHVPGHRICDHCGSHWSHGDYAVTRRGEFPALTYERARFY